MAVEFDFVDDDPIEETPKKKKRVPIRQSLRNGLYRTHVGRHILYNYDCPYEECKWSFGCFNSQGSFATLIRHLRVKH